MRACTQCGKCCLKYSAGSGLGSATECDVELWEQEAPEILIYTDSLLHDLWISPVTGEEMNRCPWLRKLPRKEKYKCKIYKFRPEACQGYPVSIEQMTRDGCEMLEEGDFNKSKDELMKELSSIINTT